MRLGFLCLLWFCYASPLRAQEKPVQSVKGRVIDRSLKTPLPGAVIEMTDLKNRIVLTDSSGNFVFKGISVGRHTLSVNFIGYKTIVIPNLSVESGKELFLSVEMEEEIATAREIILTSSVNKSKALNQSALVSARMFSVEETRRFAAGLNDPARIATAFAGVTGNGDKNALFIRGNAPNGLLWRMEGVDIPNPNHFARVGTSGGGISILSAQLLSNSDFMTGAFPAEYGNALSGVFDIHLRKGNTDKREHTLSLSTIGIDAATEGYVKKGSKSSYLVNYRYGFLTLMQQLGFKINNAKDTYFQDLSFNVHLDGKKAGDFGFFGFGGLSKQVNAASRDSITWAKDPSQRSGSRNISNTGAIGVSHSILLGKKTRLHSIVSVNGDNYEDENNKLEKYNAPLITTRDNRFAEQNLVMSVTLTHKLNKQHLFKVGAYSTAKGFDLRQKEAVSNILKDKINADGNTRLTNIFAQWRMDATSRLRIQAGLHGQYFSLNKTSSIEPRIGLRFMVAKNQYLSLGYGLHGQVQPLGNYFARIKVGTDSIQPNHGLDFSRSAHYIAGYSIQFAPNWSLKMEAYYQSLYNIPITAGKATSYSTINLDDDYAIEPLNNAGKGKNYGLEFTLERYWNDRFYMLATLSLYSSRYLASDNIWRDTRYNSNSAWTFLMGKEWELKKKSSTLSLDLKMIHNGGVRVTTIDLAQSIAKNATVLNNQRIYADKLPAFFRVDLQAEWRTQYRKMTGAFIAGVQNLTNRDNPVSQSFDTGTKQIRYSYLLGLIPVIGYKIDF